MRYDYTQYSVYFAMYEQLALLEIGLDESLFISEGDALHARKPTQRWVHSAVQNLFRDASDGTLSTLSKQV